MINYKTKEEIEVMKESCQLAAEVLVMIEPYVKPGVTTERLNQICHDYIVSKGAVPSPLNYCGFPKVFAHLLMRKFVMGFHLIENFEMETLLTLISQLI